MYKERGMVVDDQYLEQLLNDVVKLPSVMEEM